VTIIRRATALAVIVAVGTSLGAGLLWAHVALVRSSPAADSHLPEPPAELRLEFNEAVTARTSRIELVAPDSQRTSLTPRADWSNAKVLLASVPALSTAGRYRVEWRLVGPDGHAVTGRYGFTIDSIWVAARVDSGRAREPAAAMEMVHEETADSFLEQAFRFVAFTAMLAILGAIAFAVFVLPRASLSSAGATEAHEAIESRLRSWVVGGAWFLLVVGVARLTSHAILLSGSFGALRPGDVTDLLFGSTFGRGWMLQMVTALLFLVGLRSGRPARWNALVGAGIALAISASFLGHPAAVPDVPLLAMSFDAIHVLAAGGWAGGILVLLFAAMPALTAVNSTDRVAVARNFLRAFSPLALTCAALLAATGLAAAWLQLRRLEPVLGSVYGLTLARKVVVVLLIAALGAYHWRLVQPSIDSDRAVSRLRTSLALDVGLVLLVLVFTAILTGTAPPVR
jgi:copper transport protein